MHRGIFECLYMAISIKYCIPFIYRLKVITISIIYIRKSICKRIPTIRSCLLSKIS
uniref:Uncharacterized protein n=1 Tax=Podoviridae sp. ctsNK10 TaxID=2826582 RepID=A0A8S5NLN1_9CAUD|nr:MAG TPA: hypothetical protein [Podoviridae sp. ctsNK10]